MSHENDPASDVGLGLDQKKSHDGLPFGLKTEYVGDEGHLSGFDPDANRLSTGVSVFHDCSDGLGVRSRSSQESFVSVTNTNDGDEKELQDDSHTTVMASTTDVTIFTRKSNGSLDLRHKTSQETSLSAAKTAASLPKDSIERVGSVEEVHPSQKPESMVQDESKEKHPDEIEQNETPEDDTYQYPAPWALTLISISLALGILIISLDRTIITTAIPRITDDFHSYDDVGWYGSSYFITSYALQPMYGRIFAIFDIKWSFLAALTVFEIGSFICGIAPSSLVFIIGRAIAGFGSAGILAGSFVVLAHSVPLRKRPVYIATVGMMFSVGALIGPLLGGVFTDRVSWRWCFYFNLPIGGLNIVVTQFFLNSRKNAASGTSIVKRILQLDLEGNALLLGGAIMFFLALQYTDQQYPWGSPRVIGLLVGAAVAISLFLAWQRKKGDEALMPPNIILQRSIAMGCLTSFFIYSALLVHMFFLPIWFQAIKGESPIGSGVSMISYVAASATFSLIGGVLVSKIGYFAPPCIVGCAIGTVGAGLISTLQMSTPVASYVGYQILTAVGLGVAIQQGFVAAQTVLRPDQIPIGTAAVASFQSLGGAVITSVGNTILQNQLLEAARTPQLANVDIQAVIKAGATQFRSFVPEDSLPGLLIVYNSALQKVFIAAIPLAGLAFVSALGFEWKSVKDTQGTTRIPDEEDTP